MYTTNECRSSNKYRSKHWQFKSITLHDKYVTVTDNTLTKSTTILLSYISTLVLREVNIQPYGRQELGIVVCKDNSSFFVDRNDYYKLKGYCGKHGIELES